MAEPAQAPTAPDGMPPGLPRILAVATITIGLMMSVLSNSMTNLALPYIAQDLGISAESSIWIVNASQIALMVTLLPVAALADIVGYRHVYRFGLVLFSIASIGCALAPSLPWLIAARALCAGVVGYQRLQRGCRTADAHGNGKENNATRKQIAPRAPHGFFSFHNTTSSQNKQ